MLEACFAPCNRHCEFAQVFMDSNRLYWRTWHKVLPGPEDDAELSFSRIGRGFGLSAYKAERVFLGLDTMSYLPRLTRLQEQDWFLDYDRIIAIGQALLGVKDEVYMHVDEALVELFTPSRRNQHLPDAGRIRATIVEVLAQFYSEPEGKENPESYRLQRRGDRAHLELTLDALTLESVDRLVRKRAEAEGISLAAALAALVLDPVKTKLVINTFQPVGSSLAHLEGYGFLEVDSEDMREVGPAEESAYRPSAGLRAFVEGRDGTCRWPGCRVPAHRCQLDHRVNYHEGGPTSSDNLASLCQHHHNIKTDKRAFYLLDPLTGDIYWLFADGTWESTLPQGPIVTDSANWKQSVIQRIDAAAGRKERMRGPMELSFS